jgi:predicted O-linked N-acetylglucosamine transferase (SPINDLY family)
MTEILSRALDLHKQGKLEEAKKIYNGLLKKDSNNFELLNLLGIVTLQLKNYRKAIIIINRAIKINPSHHALYNNLGVVYKELEEYDDAIKNFKKAFELNANYAEALCNLGIISVFLKKYDEAYAYYKNCLRIKPNYSEGYNNLGLLFHKTMNVEKAIDNFNISIKINSSNIDAYKNRSNSYIAIQKYLLALEDYYKLIILDPKNKNIYESRIFFTKKYICDWGDYYNYLKRLEDEINKKKILINYIRPWELTLISDSPKIISKYSDYYNKSTLLKKNYKIKNQNNLKKKKIRIAYYSTDYQRHPVSHLLVNVLENHDKNNFEIFGFHFHNIRPDDMTDRISKAFDQFIDIRNVTDEEVIFKSRNLNIDIAIDLNGHTSKSRMNLFVNRVAPIQINYLGYPGTVGKHMDYIIADKNLIPYKDKKFYFEKIIYMPDCYQPYDSNKIINSNFNREEFNLPKSGFVFACLNNVVKINPIIFDCWMRILNKTNNTSFCFLESNKICKDYLINEIKSRGVDINRIFFSPLIPYENIFQRYQLCDLFLDTFPYSGHTTASEALSSGLPLLTLAGNSFQSRVSLSLLKNLSLPELITYNIQDYENYAIFLANNPEELEKIKKKLILSIKNSNTFNTKLYTKNLEHAYKLVQDRYYRNLTTEDIHLN